MNKSWSDKFISTLRNLRSRGLFKALEHYCNGRVLDIGGWDFYATIIKKPTIQFDSWTSVEIDSEHLFPAKDPRYKTVIGDGCHLAFPDNSFDTVVNIQVLEHTFEPIKMVEEMGRVLKPGGYGVFLIPQTSVLHHPPRHYYNFTKFWIQESIKCADMKILELKPLGGLWTTTASHLVHFFFQSMRFPGYTTQDDKRKVFFYLFWPLMVIFSIISIPLCLLFGLGDLTEEPNNWLVVVKK